MIIGIEKFLSIHNKLVIDMRTKEEYQSGHVMNAINFEILNYEERKKVSILYNKGLNQKAYLLAYEFALDKLPKLFKVIKANKDKSIVLYCARGGSRSTIVYEVFKNLKGIDVYKIEGGYKNYRQFINTFFSTTLNAYNFKVIYENIGIKLNVEALASDTYLLLDLRKDLSTIQNPFSLLKPKIACINHRVLNNIIFEKIYHSSAKRIVLLLPMLADTTDILHESLNDMINSSDGICFMETLEERIKHLEKNYFVDTHHLKPLLDFLENNRKSMSNAIVDEINTALNNKEFTKGIRLLLVNHWDPLVEYFIDKKRLKWFRKIKEIIKYLESWSE